MAQVVQAKCPHCQNMLRIPAAWLSQPMKCKFCQQIFQTKAAAATGVPSVTAMTPLPPVAPAGVAAPAGDFHFDQPEEYAGAIITRPRRKKGRWKGFLLLLFLLGIGGAGTYFAWPYLNDLIHHEKKQDQVAQHKGKPDTAPDHKVNGKTPKSPDKTPLETDKKKGPKTEPKTDPTEDPSPEDPPPKIDPNPKKKDPEITPKKDPNPKMDPQRITGAFPRRALLVNVSNYLLFNPLKYGKGREGKYPGSSTAVLADQLSRPPFNIPATQIYELSDGFELENGLPGKKPKSKKEPRSTVKQTIEFAISDFVDSSREQDRIVVLFTGHALEIEKEAYLVPVEGNRDDAKSLIPLSWVYDKLAQCKARQKLLILDVFRYPPARGEEIPGTGEMTEAVDAKLQNPLAGVQVWASCTKGQQAIEFDGGSVFLQALCQSLQERLPGIAEPTHPLPLDSLVPKVNQRLKELLGPQKLEQMSRLTGKELEGGAAYDPNLPLPKLTLRGPDLPGGNTAGLAMVKNILDEINLLPTVRDTQNQLQATSLPAFSAKALAEYKADYKTMKELAAMAKDKEKYPLRAAVLEISKALQETKRISMKESLTNPGGAITPQIKAQFLKEQQTPGLMIFELEKLKAEIDMVADKRDVETSKRWQAHFDYAVARLQSRLVFLYEYNNILAQVRSDSLPALEPIHNGWRVGSQKKVQINEPKVKDMVKSIGKTWKRIAEENPGTPWAILAQRESMTALGLVWRPSRE